MFNTKERLKKSLLLYCVLTLTGCGLAAKVLFGIDATPNWLFKEDIVRYTEKQGIPMEYSFVMDTARYYNELQALYRDIYTKTPALQTDSLAYEQFAKVLKDDSQPTQFRLFNKEGKELFKLVNCYVEQPIAMNWNVQGCLNTFPPQINSETLNQHYYDLDFLLSNIHRLENGSSISRADLPQADYYAVIFWNSFFKKPSRKLIKTIRNYVAEQDADIQLLYINNHNAEIWALADTAAKERIKAFYEARSE